MHACMRRASSRRWILIFMNGVESPAASQQKVPHVGARKPFVWVVKQGSVYLGLLDWRCPLSKWCFSCQRWNKWEPICISLIPPLLLAPPEEFDFISPPLRIPSLFCVTVWIQVRKETALFFKSRISGAEWLIDMCFHSVQDWSVWLKRHDWDPWWAYGLKALSDCLAIPPTLIEA